MVEKDCLEFFIESLDNVAENLLHANLHKIVERVLDHILHKLRNVSGIENLLVAIEIEFEAHVHQLKEFDPSRAESLLLGAKCGLEGLGVPLFAKQVHGLLDTAEDQVEHTLSDFEGFDDHVVFVLLFAALLDRQILDDGDQDLASVHLFKLTFRIKLVFNGDEVFGTKETLDQNRAVFY